MGENRIKNYIFLLFVFLMFNVSCEPKNQTPIYKFVESTSTITPKEMPTATNINYPTPTNTILIEPIKQDLGVSMDVVKEYFEDFGFSFFLRPSDPGTISVYGKSSDAFLVVLTGNPDMLVDAYFSISSLDVSGLEEIERNPGLGDLPLAIFGDEYYRKYISPWLKNQSIKYHPPLCIDGYMISWYLEEDSGYLSISIILKQDWAFTTGSCE